MAKPADAHVFTIPAGASFAAALARGLIRRAGGDPLKSAAATVFLPTRRAVRDFPEIFARAAGGATLLPDLRPLGDVDEDEFDIDPYTDDFAVPPPIAPLRRRLLLAAMIRRWSQNRGAPLSFGQSAGLAAGLARVMDEAEIAGADLSRLDDLAPAELAAHWAEVKDFLSLVRTEWPKILAGEGCINPAAARNDALRAEAQRFSAHPPPCPVIAAGSTGSIPATAELLAAIAHLAQGAVILPGLDLGLDEESWSRLDPGHPQYGMKRLLERMGLTREDVAVWDDATGNPAREALLSEVLRPAPTTDAWRALAEAGGGGMAAGLDGLTLVEAADPAEEAAAIALMLREALETPGRTAALVTRDRRLARRTAAALKRWNITIDDSAGRPLSHTRAGSFLCLLAETVDAGFAPVPLLALLKHPLAAMEDRTDFRRRARALDLALRGPRPNAGLGGVAARLKGVPELAAWFARIAGIFTPFADLLAAPEIPLEETLEAHVKVAEALAGEALWLGADGEAAKKFVDAVREAAAGIPAIEARSYAPLFANLAAEVPVRPAYGGHPRLAILGPLEARMQRFDLTVLGGLNEGSWPAAAPADPWFSRPMRRALGLEQPERSIGLSAHDFASLAAAPEVVLTRAAKAEGAPAVASRWLQRLAQLAKGLGLFDRLKPVADYPAIARALDDPGVTRPAPPPRPCPPVAARPRRLSVTEIETWLRDPYAIYAKHVLGLKPLDPLDAPIGPPERGTILHRALERFVKAYPATPPDDAAARLIGFIDAVFAEEETPKAVIALWRPRFVRAAFWFVEEEKKRREGIAESFVEISGKKVFHAPAGEFVLSGKADRIDRLKAGGGVLLDYKTGMPPSEKQVEAMLAPQLPLEGAILSSGGFAEVGPLAPAGLIYVRITGGVPPGETKPIAADAGTLAADATERLAARIAEFDDPATAYDSRTTPQFAKGEGDYDHLARLKEWSTSGWGGEET